MKMGGNEINLPSTLFTCKSLESLELSGWFTLQVPTRVCLPKLQVFEFYGPCLVSNALKISSLSLRRLVVRNNREPIPVYDKKLEIDAPNLEFLFLDLLTYDCSMKSPSASLNEAILDLRKNCIADSYADFANGLYNNGRCNSTVKLVEALNRAKCLCIGEDTMMAISRATIPLSTRFERLTELKVAVRCCEWSSLSVMFGCCSRLQSFSIMVSGSCGITHKRCWKDPEQVPECLLSSLARVSFVLFKGLEDEMSMVRYLLKHGSVLVSFAVSADLSTANKKLQMIQAISKFPRLSSACSVDFA